MALNITKSAPVGNEAIIASIYGLEGQIENVTINLATVNEETLALINEFKAVLSNSITTNLLGANDDEIDLLITSSESLDASISEIDYNTLSLEDKTTVINFIYLLKS